LAFPKFDKEVSIWHQRQSTAGVVLPQREFDLLHWLSDKDDALGLVYLSCNKT